MRPSFGAAAFATDSGKTRAPCNAGLFCSKAVPSARIALTDHAVLAYHLCGFLAAIELGAQAPDLLGAQAFGVAVVELPAHVPTPAQRRVYGSSRGRRRFQQAQRQLQREHLRLPVTRPARAVPERKVAEEKARHAV